MVNKARQLSLSSGGTGPPLPHAVAIMRHLLEAIMSDGKAKPALNHSELRTEFEQAMKKLADTILEIHGQIPTIMSVADVMDGQRLAEVDAIGFRSRFETDLRAMMDASKACKSAGLKFMSARAVEAN